MTIPLGPVWRGWRHVRPRGSLCGARLAKDAAAALKQALQIQQNFPESEDARKRLAELEKKP